MSLVDRLPSAAHRQLFEIIRQAGLNKLPQQFSYVAPNGAKVRISGGPFAVAADNISHADSDLGGWLNSETDSSSFERLLLANRLLQELGYQAE